MAASARMLDKNGYLLVKRCPITSSGIFDYSAAQVGLPGDPNRIVKVYRPESEVADPQLLASLRSIPLINDHKMLSGFEDDDSAEAPEDYGVDGVLTNDIEYASPWIVGDIKVFTRTLQSELASGKQDLSLGYTCDFDVEHGTFNGQKYEVVQRNLRGNHLALVDHGRVPGARVLDGRHVCYDHMDVPATLQIVSCPQGVLMAKRVKGRMTLDADVVSNLKAQLKALLPTFEQFLNEEAAEPAHQAVAAPAAEAATVDPLAATAATTSSEAVQPPAVAPPAVSVAEPTDQGGAADLPALVAQLKAILAQLEAAMGGGAEPAAAEPAAAAAEPAAAAAEPAAEPNPPKEGGEGDEGGGEETEDEGEGGGDQPYKGVDPIEGIQDEDITEGGPGKASAGPSAGEHSGGDSAMTMKDFYADAAAKKNLYDRLSKVIGAFDHSAMDCAEVAAYGAGKLKIKVTKGQEFHALDAYLTGAEEARKSMGEAAKKAVTAQDSTGKFVALDEYLAG